MISKGLLKPTMARRRNKGEERAIAAKRMDILLARARVEALGPDADLAPRYVAMARKVAMKQQMPLRPHHKVQMCRGCNALRTSQTTRVRIHRGRIITTCACGHTHRRPLGQHHGHSTS